MSKRTHYQAITDVPGIEVGQMTDLRALTGCTVVLCRRGATVGVSVRGGGPGTRETDLCRPAHPLVTQAHAVLLAGGSAYGLAAADGVMRYLEEQGIGYDTGAARVPIVPAAILWDLGMGDARVRPDAAMGYAACRAAAAGPVEEGNVGAGTGAAVGWMLGRERCTKGGLGTASRFAAGRLVVGAIVAVNCLGDVVDPQTGQIVAGTRRLVGSGFANTLALMCSGVGRAALAMSHTVIGVIATNAALDGPCTNFVAEMAHDGMARAVRPAHTLHDGDTLFALATGRVRADASVVGALAAEALAEAIVRAVRAARGVAGMPAAGDLAGPAAE
jgi:L-aminopeptidase/D-esterase-like protein